VNSDQAIRVAAAQAAATLMAPVQPLPADFVATAEVIEAYIRDGRNAAFALCPGGAPPVPDPQPAPVIEPAPRAVPDPVAAEEPQQDAEVIPLAARAPVSQKQEGARRIIEKQRKTRVDSIMGQATVAKAKIHKQRLMDEAEENGLSEYMVVVNDKPITLGDYLGSL
jgi:hypothetical protein